MAASAVAGVGVAGAPSADPSKRFAVKRLTFRGDFDGANIAGVQLALDADGVTEFYEVMVSSDCAGTKYEAEFKMWYQFSISGGTPGQRVRIVIANLNPMVKVYAQDLRPIVRIPSLSPNWERLLEPSTFEISAGRLRLSFVYTFGSPAPVHFALYYPFAYSDCQRLLRNIDHALGTAPSTAAADRPSAGSGSSSSRSRLRARLRHTGDPSADIYYHRELLTLSPEGRRIELLTISSCAGRLSERIPPIDGLFPDGGARPHRFKGKPVVYVGARVHPGETAASYMVHGLLAFLLQPRNPYARALRNRFVFHVVPMINPDGVARGHFRTDVYGVNLNRLYASPSATKQPAIFAIKSVLRQASTLFSPVALEGSGRGGGTPVFAFIDLHGFTARHGCYVIGNPLPMHRESRSLMFAQLMQLYAPQFNANACSFGKSKRGIASKRVLYSTPYGQLVQSALTPVAEATSAAISPGVSSSSTSATAEDGSVGVPQDADMDDGADEDDDEEDGADAVATPRSVGDVEEDAAAEADALRRSGRTSPPIAAAHTITHESYAGELARVQDPYSVPTVLLPAGQRTGSTTSRLADSEATKVSREWQAMKARITGKGEGVKEGTGRVCALKDFSIPHCYTVECSCNLLSHRRVYDRIFAAAHIHHTDSSGHHASAHGTVDPKALIPPVAALPTPAGAALPAGHSMMSEELGTSESSRIARIRDRKVVSCPRCDAEPRSQLGLDRARALRSALAAGDTELGNQLQLQPVPGYSSRHPYSCQVDSLQPPPGCADYVPPFGFPTKAPKDDAFVCPWGTCHADPPSSFAAVGRGMAFALLDISGGTNGLYSRVTYSQWGSLDNMQRWSRRCSGAAYGVSESGSASRLSSRSATAQVMMAGAEAAGGAVTAARAAIASNKVAATPPVARRKRKPNASRAAASRATEPSSTSVGKPTPAQSASADTSNQQLSQNQALNGRAQTSGQSRQAEVEELMQLMQHRDEAKSQRPESALPASSIGPGSVQSSADASDSAWMASTGHPEVPGPSGTHLARHAWTADDGSGSRSHEIGKRLSSENNRDDDDSAAMSGVSATHMAENGETGTSDCHSTTPKSEAARLLLRRIAAGTSRTADGRAIGRARSFHGQAHSIGTSRPGMTDGLRMSGMPLSPAARDEQDPRHGNASPSSPRPTHPPSPPEGVMSGGNDDHDHDDEGHPTQAGHASNADNHHQPRFETGSQADGGSQADSSRSERRRGGAAHTTTAFIAAASTGNSTRGRFAGISRLAREELQHSASMDDLRAGGSAPAPTVSISSLPISNVHSAMTTAQHTSTQRFAAEPTESNKRSALGDRSQPNRSPGRGRQQSSSSGAGRDLAGRFQHRPLVGSVGTGTHRVRMGSSVGRHRPSADAGSITMDGAAVAGNRLATVPLSQVPASTATLGGHIQAASMTYVNTSTATGVSGNTGSSRGSSLRLAGLSSVGRQTPSPPLGKGLEMTTAVEDSDMPAPAPLGSAVRGGRDGQTRSQQRGGRGGSENGEQAIDRFLRELAALEAAVDGSATGGRRDGSSPEASAFTARQSMQGHSPTMIAPVQSGGTTSVSSAASVMGLRRQAIAPQSTRRPPARPAVFADESGAGRGPSLSTTEAPVSRLKPAKQPRSRRGTPAASTARGVTTRRRGTVNITGSRLTAATRRR